VISYMKILDEKMPELQIVIARSKNAMTERVVGMEDEEGAALAETGSYSNLPWGT
jgi:hypothetical protein